jgi:hypothetical protein
MSTSGSTDRERARQVPEGIRALLVSAAVFGTFFVGALLVGAAYWWLRDREGRVRPSGAFEEAGLQLRERVSGVLQEPFDIPGARPSERELQERELRRFGWVDRERRIVRIPIERAMELMAGGGPLSERSPAQ